MRYTDGYLEGLLRRAKTCDIEKYAGAIVIVTGASGLVGSALADVLLCANAELGLEARVVLAGRDGGRMATRFAHWGRHAYEYAVYDAARPVDFSFSADYVFHCASNANPRLYATMPVETLVENVEGMTGLLGYMRRCESPRLLYVSSSEVYGSREGMEPYREKDQFYVDPLSPRSCYPSSKRACETLCASYRAEYGIDFVVARPGYVWGPMCTPSDTRAHAEFARDAAGGHDIVMKSPGSQLRSYMYAVDAAGAMLEVMALGEPGAAYNIGVPGFACTIRQFADALAEAGGVVIVRDFPSEQEAAGYSPVSCSALDCSRLKSLGFEAQFTLKEAARQTVECMRGVKLP